MAETSPVVESPQPVDFTVPGTVAEWNVSSQQWLKMNEIFLDEPLDGLSSSALVFDNQGRILLLQRAAHDSWPNTWEVPGGAVDKGDPTILHACARELREEAGLKVRNIEHVILDGAEDKPGADFMNSTETRRYRKFSFEVKVDTGTVKLDPNEHQAFVWAAEEEVKNQAIGDRKIPLANTMMDNLLRVGFEMRRSGKKAKE